MSLWFCPNHRLTAAGSQVPFICDACGSPMSLAMMHTSFGQTEIVDIKSARQQVAEAIAQERQRCAGIVERVISTKRNGNFVEDDLMAQDLIDNIQKEINADGE